MSRSFESNVHFFQPGVGIFPNLSDIQHGFSWGHQKNMALRWTSNEQERIEAMKSYLEFLGSLGMSTAPIGVSLEPTDHNDQIVGVDHDALANHIQTEVEAFCSGVKPHFDPIHVEGNFVYTYCLDLPLFVKPADCPCAIIYGRDASERRVLGLLHAGRDQLDANLPTEVINHLVDVLSVKKDSIKIGIAPSISDRFYCLKRKDMGLLKHPEVWEGYLSESDSYESLLLRVDVGGQIHLNLLKRLYDFFLETGLIEDQIFAYQVDTFTAAQRGESFSHRFATLNDIQNGRFIVAAQLG